MAITRQKALTKVFGDPQKKIISRLEKRVGEVNKLEDTYKAFKKPATVYKRKHQIAGL